MIRLIMIPVMLAVGALIMLWINERQEDWRRGAEIGRMVRESRRHEDDARNTEREQMRGGYAVCLRSRRQEAK